MASDGCVHAAAASAACIEAYALAVKLSACLNSVEVEGGAAPSCAVCGYGTSICCLQCDFVGCLKHAEHEHDLGALAGPGMECAVFCFKCRDLQVNTRFESAKADQIHALLGATLNNANSNSNQLNQLTQSFSAFAGLRGFINLGSTCYASVVLQSLVHNPLVKTFFLGGGHQREKCTQTSCLACSVDSIYTSFYGSDSVAGYGITDMLVALSEKQPVMGAGSTEQDAHEFYLMLLSEFHKTHMAKGPFSTARNPENCGCITHRHFSGTLCSTLSCECGATASKEEPIIDLGLDLGSLPETTLQECLQRFTSGELIANYTCEKCGESRKTTKKLLLQSLPPVLMVQLKRFKIHNSGSSKMESPVDFGLEIDLQPYTNQGNQGTPLVYELFGVICHTGSLDTGHYTCYMKHSTGAWYHFDDSMVQRVGIENVKQTRTAYLLLYVVKSAI